MIIRIPKDVPYSLQIAFGDIDTQLTLLQKKIDGMPQTATPEEVARLRVDLAKVARAVDRPVMHDTRNVFRAAGPAAALGHVPNPGSTSGLGRVLMDTGFWSVLAAYQVSNDPSQGGPSSLDVQGALHELSTEKSNDTQPACRVYLSTNQAITTGAGQAILFDSERFDPSGMHDTNTNTDRITIATAGKYLIGINARFAADVAGTFRALQLRLGSSVIGMNTVIPSGQVLDLIVVTLYDLATNDILTAYASHDAGHNVNITALGNQSPEFWAIRMGA